MNKRLFSASLARFACLAIGTAALAACSSINSTSERLVERITPYSMEIVQGNFVSKEQVQALRPGMSREQVRNILGSPLVTSLFHADRWDYIFTIKRKGVDIESKHLTVYFNGFVLDRVEGDEMPSEDEFVSELAGKTKTPKIPKLEATPEQLEKYAPKPEDASAAEEAASKPAPLPASSYPPLER